MKQLFDFMNKNYKYDNYNCYYNKNNVPFKFLNIEKDIFMVYLLNDQVKIRKITHINDIEIKDS